MLPSLTNSPTLSPVKKKASKVKLSLKMKESLLQQSPQSMALKQEMSMTQQQLNHFKNEHKQVVIKLRNHHDKASKTTNDQSNVNSSMASQIASIISSKGGASNIQSILNTPQKAYMTVDNTKDLQQANDDYISKTNHNSNMNINNSNQKHLLSKKYQLSLSNTTSRKSLNVKGSSSKNVGYIKHNRDLSDIQSFRYNDNQKDMIMQSFQQKPANDSLSQNNEYNSDTKQSLALNKQLTGNMNSPQKKLSNRYSIIAIRDSVRQDDNEKILPFIGYSQPNSPTKLEIKNKTSVNLPIIRQSFKDSQSHSIDADKFIPQLSSSYRSLQNQEPSIQFWYQKYSKHYVNQQEKILSSPTNEVKTVTQNIKINFFDQHKRKQQQQEVDEAKKKAQLDEDMRLRILHKAKYLKQSMANEQLINLIEDSIELSTQESNLKLKKNLSQVKNFIQSYDNNIIHLKKNI